MTRAFISFLPAKVLPQLWPRCWQWIQCLDRYSYFLPASDSVGELENRLCYFWILDRFYSAPETAEAVNLTPGVRVLVAQAWAVFLHHAHTYGDISGLSSVCKYLRGRETLALCHQPVNEAHHLAHVEEVVEGAGGTVDDLAILLVNHIDLIPDNPEQTEELLDGLVVFLRDARFRGLLWAPETFVSAGMLDVLIDTICAVRDAESVRAAKGVVMALDICFHLLGGLTQSDLNRLRTALKTGLLRAIVSCAAVYADMPQIHAFLRRDLPACSIHYHVLRQIRVSMAEIHDVTATPEFAESPIWEDWKKFSDLADERAALMDVFDSEEYKLSRACDNLECGAILERAALRRCAGCMRHYYCSGACQRRDWYTGGHRSGCFIRCICKTRSRPRDRDFIRAILHKDYLHSKHSILECQVSFLAVHPDQSFYIGFDYSNGRAEVKLHGFDKLVHVCGPWGIPNEPCNDDQLARAHLAGGRLGLHRAFISHGGMCYMRWFPLFTTSNVLDEGVRRLARELEGADSEERKPWLLEKITELISETEVTLVEIH
ncbi:hypothetical protein C8R43DRAFT_1045301 [Mycena crocata]|nr:hypothetical protein C8R43DRAFT_1045301 [Mycena crocata]